MRNFSLSVEKYFTSERSEREKYFSTWEEQFVSPSGHVIFYLLYKHQWNAKPFLLNIFCCERGDLLCSHSNCDLFTCENNMLWRYHVFARKLTWYFIGVYIININIMSYIQLKMQKIRTQCDKSTRPDSSIDGLKISKPTQKLHNTTPKSIIDNHKKLFHIGVSVINLVPRACVTLIQSNGQRTLWENPKPEPQNPGSGFIALA